MVYKFKEGAKFSVDANVAGTVCEELANEGKLTAENLVDVSREETAPLHKCFTWDNEKAAEKYRQQQARCLIGALEIVVEESQTPIRGFFNLSVEAKTSNYVSTQIILREEDKRAMLLQLALKELQSFKHKYETLTELAKVFEDIDGLTA